jgi:ferredoxin
MIATVNQETCIGCGLCAEVCFDVFEMGADDLAKVKVKLVPEELEGLCRETAADCPVDAIGIEE